MKPPLRIIAPVLLAAACAGLLMAFLWWQLTKSTLQLGTIKRGEQTAFDITLPMVDTSEPIDDGDVSLLHLRQGDLLALQGEWPEALSQYERAVKAGGGLTALRKLARAQLQQRDISAVESTIKKMEAEGARTEDILLLEIIIELRSGELLKAQNRLEQAEDSPQKHYGLALLSIIQGNHESAIRELTEVAAGWDPVLRNNARTLQSAYDEFALFPEGSDLHLITLLSRALAQVQECELALPLLVQVTSVQDDYRDAWIVQGYCELTTDRPEQALASLEHAYSLDPQKPEIQYFLARAYADMKQYQNAITFFEYALSNGFIPEGEVRRLIARYSLEIGNASLALTQYEALTNNESATLEHYRGFIEVALPLGRADEALAKAIEATEKFEEDAKAHELLGDVARELKDTDLAKRSYERALQINSSTLSVQKKLQAIE